MVKDPSVYKVCDRQKLDQKELVFPFDKRNRAEEEKEDKKCKVYKDEDAVSAPDLSCLLVLLCLLGWIPLRFTGLFPVFQILLIPVLCKSFGESPLESVEQFFCMDHIVFKTEQGSAGGVFCDETTGAYLEACFMDFSF